MVHPPICLPSPFGEPASVPSLRTGLPESTAPARKGGIMYY